MARALTPGGRSVPVAPIQIEGYREFQRAVGKAVDKDLPKRMGQVHKDVGRFIISNLEPAPDPRAVGEGYGAMPRASATRRDLLIIVGGAHRADNEPPYISNSRPGARPWAYVTWGKRQIGKPGTFRPPRPHIIGTAIKHEGEIRQRLLDGVTKALAPAFHDAD